MRRKFVAEWLGLTVAVAVIVPAIMWVAMVVRMAFIGDKPDEAGQALEHAEHLQWVVQIGTYFIGVALLSFVLLLVIRRK